MFLFCSIYLSIASAMADDPTPLLTPICGTMPAVVEL